MHQRWASWLRPAGPALALAWQRTWCGIANLRRRLFRARLPDYVVITLDHAISERAPAVPWYYAYIPGLKLPLSLEYLADALRRIASDPDVKGVVFLLKGPTLSLAQAQSLAGLFERFRAWDRKDRARGVAPKQILVHLEQISTAGYVLATAADRITVTPLTTWEVIGLRLAPTYLKDTLARLGLQFDVVKIAPWKTAMDNFTRADMSDAERDQYNWLLDSLSEDIVQAIAAGRGLSPDRVRELINCAPLSPDEAQMAGLVDAVLYEDELPVRLEPLLSTGPAHAEEAASQPEDTEPAKLRPYAQSRGLLLRRPRARAPGQVGVLSLEGAIIPGESRSFPIPMPVIGNNILGSNTAEQQIRAARRDRSLAAVVVHVDSNGGSALASDLIWRELILLGQEKPVIVYMGNVAASGGYYIATPGSKIVAQSATLTGSIGVVTAKLVTAGAVEKLDARREVMQRGDNAGIYADDSFWEDDQRRRIEESIHYVYRTFKARVAEGRGLPLETLDEICNGRVWTGKQAKAHGLVDEIGDFQVALDLACQAAALPADGSVKTKTISAPKRHLLAAPANAAAYASIFSSIFMGHQATGDWRQSLLAGDWQGLVRERFWLIADDLPQIGG